MLRTFGLSKKIDIMWCNVLRIVAFGLSDKIYQILCDLAIDDAEKKKTKQNKTNKQTNTVEGDSAIGTPTFSPS